ncbi:MAG: hypothetical protein ACYTGN_18845 [Planctomycetota bacterium]|jgi:hypothetical protein
MRILLILALALASCAATPHRADWPILGTEPAADEGGEGKKKNRASVFVGATHKGSETGFSTGVKYVRRLSRILGAGVVVEFTPDLRERLVTVPALFVYPYKALSLMVAPGVEVEDGVTSFMVRRGAGWEFELGKGFTLAPELSVDFVEGSSDIPVVLGVSFGYGF